MATLSKDSLDLSGIGPITAAGIDGCRAGWVVAYREGGEVNLVVIGRLSDINVALAPDASVMIDMPIGLTDDNSVRICDASARVALRPYRSSSVFGVPARKVTRCGDYPEANRLSREMSGKGISKQAFYLFPKIRELDDWLVSKDRNGQWFECHPEVAFARLNGAAALAEPKKTVIGSTLRKKLLWELGSVESTIQRALDTYRRKDVLADDLIDALVCLLTAERSSNERLQIPNDAPVDARGLTMVIVAPA
jgi:predicted RNase H-like nuclease